MTLGKQSGLGDNFYIGGYDLSGDVSALSSISGSMSPIDVTGIKQSANSRIGGLRTGDMQFTTFFDQADTISAPGFPLTTVPVTNTYSQPVVVVISGGTISEVAVNGSNVGSVDGGYLVPAGQTIAVTYTGSPSWTWTLQGAAHNALSTLPRTDVIASYFRGTTLLNPCASMRAIQLNYDPTRDNAGNLTMAVECQSDGYGLEWGVMLTAGLRTDQTATAGSYVEDNTTSATAFGAQMYWQLIDFAGTSVTIEVTHCATTGGSYTDLMDSGAQTGIGAGRASVSNTTTVQPYLKVTTTGTFTLAVFAVHWTRNLLAGQVY
jgi:hypothetical protein